MSNIVARLFDRDHGGVAVWRFPNEDLSISLAALADRVTAYAGVLQQRGVGRGDRVAFIADNSSELVCLLYATWYLNAVAVPLRPRSGRYHDYRAYLANCDSICQFKLIVFAGESIAEEVSAWSRELKRRALPISDIATADSACARDDLQPAAIDSHDIAVIQFSSGSTGDPKGAVVTHAMMMAQLQNIEDNHARSRTGRRVDCSASWLPINHDMGLFIGVLSPVFSACDNVLATPGYYMKNPARWFALLSRHRVDFTFSTNSVLASTLGMLRRLQRQTDVDLSELHLYIAAEKVSPVIVRRTWESLAAFGCPANNIHVGYGMAENALGATYTTGGPIKTHWFVIQRDGRLKLGEANDPQAFELASIGIPNDHHTITVRDRSDRKLPELRLGELSIESPCVSPAYYNDPQATALKLSGGRLRTGDLGFEYDGEFYFYSRIDDLIIAAGRNVVPDDIEITAESLAFVKPGSSALLGVEDRQSGTTFLHLLVEGDARWSKQDIRQRCVEIRQHILAVHDVLVRNISICSKGSIEKTSSGKKRRKVIRQRLSNHAITLLPQAPTKPIQQQSVAHDWQRAI